MRTRPPSSSLPHGRVTASLTLVVLALACLPERDGRAADSGAAAHADENGQPTLSSSEDSLAGVVAVEAPEPAPRRAPGMDAALPDTSLIDRDPEAYLRALDLLIPVAGVSRDALPPSNFPQARGVRTHEAYDILAPRGTPVLSATDGSVAKLHVSEAGGNMVYTIDASGRFVLFYAHLDRYHPGLHEGMELERGDTVGYVGTTGNAPPTVPHLHFAIVLMDEERRWWKGTAIDPQPILAQEPR